METVWILAFLEDKLQNKLLLNSECQLNNSIWVETSMDLLLQAQELSVKQWSIYSLNQFPVQTFTKAAETKAAVITTHKRSNQPAEEAIAHSHAAQPQLNNLYETKYNNTHNRPNNFVEAK